MLRRAWVHPHASTLSMKIWRKPTQAQLLLPYTVKESSHFTRDTEFRNQVNCLNCVHSKKNKTATWTTVHSDIDVFSTEPTSSCTWLTFWSRLYISDNVLWNKIKAGLRRIVLIPVISIWTHLKYPSIFRTHLLNVRLYIIPQKIIRMHYDLCVKINGQKSHPVGINFREGVL